MADNNNNNKINNNINNNAQFIHENNLRVIINNPEEGNEAEKLKLYWIHGSISSWRVLFLLHEEKINFTAIRMKIMKKQKDTQEEFFLKLNQRGKCPVLIDETFTYQQKEIVLNESLAIVQYFDRVHLNEKYTGFGTEYYHSILIKIQETNNLLEVYEPLEELFVTVKDIHLKKIVIKAYPKLLKELRYWEKYASENVYIASPFLSEADIAFFPILDYIDFRGFILDEKVFPNLYRYYNHIKTVHERARNLSYPDQWHKKKGYQRNLYTRYLKLVEESNRPKSKHPIKSRTPKKYRQKNDDKTDALDYFDGTNLTGSSEINLNNNNNNNNNN